MSKNLNDDTYPRGSSGDSDADQFEREIQSILEMSAQATQAGHQDEAVEKMLEALRLASEQAEQHPPVNLMLQEEAYRLECAGDWSGAERARRRALTLKEAEGNPVAVAKAHLDLSQLFQLRGLLEEAWASAQAATKSARRSEIGMLIAMMLENEAWIALLRNQPDPALQAVQGALETLKTGGEGIGARLWMLRARCYAAKRQWEEAEFALARGREWMCMRSYGAWGPGPIDTKAAGWEVEAALRSGRGDRPGAIEAWQRAVDYRRRVVGFAHLRGPHTLQALARSLEELALALAEHGRADEAAANRHEAAELRRLVEDGCFRGGDRAG